MASSQTSSISLKKRESIIDERLFVRYVVMNIIESEHEDSDVMEHVVSRSKKQGLYRFGNQHSEFCDEQMVEELYHDSLVHFHSLEKGGDVAVITAVVRSVEICINRKLLDHISKLPSDGLKMEELEYMLTTFWGLFAGDGSDKHVHPS
ncbi:hypothetical protein OROMI_005026 [Orobanche minor]